MTALSALVTRATNEILDTTNTTFASSMTGFNVTELQQYGIDGITDWGSYVLEKVLDTTISTAAYTWPISISSLARYPRDEGHIQSVWYWPSVSTWTQMQDYELLSTATGIALAFYHGKHPEYFAQDNKPLWLNYYAPYVVPSAGSAQITIPTWHEEAIVDYIAWKALEKKSIDQRGISKDQDAEFRNKAEYRHKSYLARRQKFQTVIFGTKG